MSESDSFIQEVSEEIRQDRMYKLWKRYAPFVIGAIVVIVGAAAVWNWMQHRAVLEARETGGAFIAAEFGSVEAQEALVDRIDDEAEVVARLRLASSLLVNDQAGRAAEVYREVAEREDLAPAYRHLAVLNAVRLEAEGGEAGALAGELAPLVEEGAPYRPLALELRAMLRLQAGDAAAAREDLEAVLAGPVTAETRQRASGLLAALEPAAAAE
ncbi:MAG TPA: hypothetical protein VMM55_10635 [Thermohalobaculum sp.]|nr:hypothetical protein [Thermohalobaculum sp.]